MLVTCLFVVLLYSGGIWLVGGLLIVLCSVIGSDVGAMSWPALRATAIGCLAPGCNAK